MKPFDSLDLEVDDMEEHHWDIEEDAEDLQGKVSSSLELGTLNSTVLTVSTESHTDCNQHSDETKWNIDGQGVEQWHEVDVDKGGCQKDSLSKPLDHVENGNEGDSCVVDLGGSLTCVLWSVKISSNCCSVLC